MTTKRNRSLRSFLYHCKGERDIEMACTVKEISLLPLLRGLRMAEADSNGDKNEKE